MRSLVRRSASFARPAVVAAVLVGGVLALPAAVPGGPAAPRAAAAGEIQVIGGCGLADAIMAANTRADSGGCANPAASGTVLITAASGFADIPGAGAGSGTGVLLDPTTAPAEMVAGGRTILPPITGDVTIEGDGGLTGIYVTPVIDLAQTCTLNPGPPITVVCAADPTAPRGARIMRVTASGSLTLRNITIGGADLKGGLSATYQGADVRGGAVYSEGPLVLDHVTMLSNTLTGASVERPGVVAGGAIWAGASLDVTGSLFRGNVITGGDGTSPDVGGDAYGADIALAAGASAKITDSVFIGSTALGGNGAAGRDGANGANGARGLNGVCGAMYDTAAATGRRGVNGATGRNGAWGGDAGDAVGVLWGGAQVQVTNSAVVFATARAGAAGHGGVGGIGGNGGRGGDGVSCTNGKPAYGVPTAAWSGSGGNGGDGGPNGSIGAPGDRGTAVATFDVGTRLDLVNVTIDHASATVPDDALLPGVTFAQWDAKRTAAATTVGTRGSGGNGAGPMPDGLPGLYGIADLNTTDEAASGAGRATLLEPDEAARVAISYSTIADTTIVSPASKERRSNATVVTLTNGTGGGTFGGHPVGFRGTILWNPAVLAVPCPHMGSRDKNVLLTGTTCLANASNGDRFQANRPMVANLVGVGAVLRPGPTPGEPAIRMHVLPLLAGGGAIDFGNRTGPAPALPYCDPVDSVPFGSASTFAVDAANAPRDYRCDSGASEYDSTVADVYIVPPSELYLNEPTPRYAYVVVPTNPGNGATLTVSTDIVGNWPFPTPLDLAGVLTFVNPTDDQFPLVIPVPIEASDVDGPTVVVTATLDGTSTGSHVATSEIPVVDDTRLEIVPNAPGTWSPCMGALPITFVASNVGHSPTAAATVELSPEIVMPGTYGIPEPVISAGGGTYTATPVTPGSLRTHITWNLPELLPGAQRQITIYAAVGPVNGTNQPSSFMTPPQPGDTVLGSASWTFPSIDPLHGYGSFFQESATQILPDGDVLQPLILDLDGIKAGEVRTLDLSPMVELPASCHPISDLSSGYRLFDVTMDVLDTSRPGSPSLFGGPAPFSLVGPQQEIGSPASGFEHVTFTAPTDPGPHTFDIVFTVPFAPEPIHRTVTYTVLPNTIGVAGSPAGVEGTGTGTTRTFSIEMAAPLPGPVTVGYEAVPATAGADDFTPVAGTVTFAPGETVKSVTVDVTGDSVHEDDEAFAFRLVAGTSSLAPGQTFATSEAWGLIQDDDVAIVDPDSTSTTTTTTTTAPTTPTTDGGSTSSTTSSQSGGGATSSTDAGATATTTAGTVASGGPTVPNTPTDASPVATVNTISGTLPTTGASVGHTLRDAAIAIVIGTALVLITMRRRRTARP